MAEFVRGAATTVHYMSGLISGPRSIDSRSSPLRVYACRWSEMQALLSFGLPAAAAVYLLTGPSETGCTLKVRPGEAGDIRRRLAEHASDDSKTVFSDLYVVTSVDGRLSKSDVKYMEARIHEIVPAVPGCVLQVDKIPAVTSCHPAERDALEELISQARLLLYSAGCRALDSEGLPFGLAEPGIDESSVSLDVDVSETHGDEYELSYDGVWARGFQHHQGFVIRAGSDVRRRENAALLTGMSERRKFLMRSGCLGEIPGIADRWRLMCNIVVGSELTAAKIVTGAHVSKRGIWRRLPEASRTIVAR